MAEENDNADLPQEEQIETTRENRVSPLETRGYVDELMADESTVAEVVVKSGCRESTVQGWKEDYLPRTYCYIGQLKEEIEQLKFELLDALRKLNRCQR